MPPRPSHPSLSTNHGVELVMEDWRTGGLVAHHNRYINTLPNDPGKSSARIFYQLKFQRITHYFRGNDAAMIEAIYPSPMLRKRRL